MRSPLRPRITCRAHAGLLSCLVAVLGHATAKGEDRCPAPRLPRGSNIFSSGQPSGSSKTWVAEVNVDAQHVYWRDDGGRLWRAAKTGGSPARIVDGGVDGILVLGDTIYYSSKKSIRRVAVGGGPASMLLKESETPTALVSDGRSVFYSVLEGGPVRQLDPSRRRVVRRFPAKGPVYLALDKEHLYAGSSQRGTIVRFPLGGGPGKVVVDEQHSLMGVAVDETAIYYSVQIGGYLKRISKDGRGTPVVLAGAMESDTEKLLLDGGYLYWLERKGAFAAGKHTLWRTRCSGGGKIEWVHDRLCDPADLTSDATSLYIANYRASAVLRMPKPGARR